MSGSATDAALDLQLELVEDAWLQDPGFPDERRVPPAAPSDLVIAR